MPFSASTASRIPPFRIPSTSSFFVALLLPSLLSLVPAHVRHARRQEQKCAGNQYVTSLSVSSGMQGTI